MAAADAAGQSASTAMPDMGGLESMDLDDGAEVVTEKELASVLLELLPATPSAQKKSNPDEDLIASLLGKPPKRAPGKPPPPRGTQQASAAAHLTPQLDTLGDRVNRRLKELQQAAVSAKQAGKGEEALLFLRRSKAFVSAVEQLLTAKEPGEAVVAQKAISSAPLSASEAGATTAAGCTGAGAAAAASVAATEATTTAASASSGIVGAADAAVAAAMADMAAMDLEEVEDEEEADEAMEAVAETGADAGDGAGGNRMPGSFAAPDVPSAPVHVRSGPTPPKTPLSQPFPSVPQMLSDPPPRAAAPPAVDEGVDEDNDQLISLKLVEYELERLMKTGGEAAAIISLERRRATLRARAVPPEQYAESLQCAINAEKAGSRERKRAGDTAGALAALRRAKVMTDELDALKHLDT